MAAESSAKKVFQRERGLYERTSLLLKKRQKEGPSSCPPVRRYKGPQKRNLGGKGLEKRRLSVVGKIPRGDEGFRGGAPGGVLEGVSKFCD